MARYNRFMGEYDPSTEYQRGDVVTFEGSAWYRKTAGKGISPIAVKKPYMVWSRMNDDISTIFPLGGVGGGSGSTGGASLAQTYTDMTPGYVNVKTGAFGTGGNWQRTDYIPVSSGDVVTFSGRIGDNMGVAGYDENKAFVASVLDRIDEGSANTYANEPLTIPEGVAYIAGCTNSPSNPITVMVYKDAKALVDAGGGGLPEGAGAYMQLVTDGEGKAQWEDKEFGKVVDWVEFFDCFASGAVASGKLSNGDNYQYIGEAGPWEAVVNFPVGSRTYGDEITTLERVETEFAYAGEEDAPFSGVKLYDPSSDEFYLLAGEREIFGTEYTCALCWAQDKYPPYVTLLSKKPINKPLPEKYLPEGVPVVPVTYVDNGKVLGVENGVLKPVYDRIIFTASHGYSGDITHDCNIPIEEFEDAVRFGLNATFVDFMENGLYASTCVSITKIKYKHWKITIYDGDGTLKHTLEYTDSGLSETTESAG